MQNLERWVTQSMTLAAPHLLSHLRRFMQHDSYMKSPHVMLRHTGSRQARHVVISSCFRACLGNLAVRSSSPIRIDISSGSPFSNINKRRNYPSTTVATPWNWPSVMPCEQQTAVCTVQWEWESFLFPCMEILVFSNSHTMIIIATWYHTIWKTRKQRITKYSAHVSQSSSTSLSV